MDVNDKTLTELLRLTQESNRMLHKMRRRAIWGGILKFVLYAIVLVAAPLWLYATYLAPTLEQVLDTYSQIQGTGERAQSQFSDIQNFLQQFQGQLPSQE